MNDICRLRLRGKRVRWNDIAPRRIHHEKISVFRFVGLNLAQRLQQDSLSSRPYTNAPTHRDPSADRFADACPYRYADAHTDGDT
jgi:hypothetical protein